MGLTEDATLCHLVSISHWEDTRVLCDPAKPSLHNFPNSGQRADVLRSSAVMWLLCRENTEYMWRITKDEQQHTKVVMEDVE